MRKKELDRIIEQIAAQNHTTAKEVRKAMLDAMEQAMEESKNDPVAQALWDAIPRKGSKPTLEEFVSFLVENTQP